MSAKRKEPARYFSHDSNARNSDKLIRLRMRHGAAGYGVFFMILERLRDEEDYMSVKDYNMIAFDLRVDASLIKSVVEDFGLFAFTEDGKCFYSESFSQRMAVKDNISKKRSQAASIRSTKKPAGVQMQCNCGANAVQNDSFATAKSLKSVANAPSNDSFVAANATDNECKCNTNVPFCDCKISAKENKEKEKEIFPPAPPIIEKEKEKKEKKKSPNGDKENPPPPSPPSFEFFLAEALDSPIWLEAIAKNLQTDVGTVCALLKGKFHEHCIRDGKQHRDITDFKSHFNRWSSQQKYSSQQNETIPTASNMRHNDSAEIRQQEFNRHIIAKLAAPDRTEPDISGNY